MTHHPHVHMSVPGGEFSLDGSRWIASRPAFLLPIRVLGKLFRRLFLTRLTDLHQAGKLAFFGAQADLADRRRFLHHLAPVRRKRWVAYAKAPFAGPEAVLAYLSRYTHRVAISNRRLIGFDEAGVRARPKRASACWRGPAGPGTRGPQSPPGSPCRHWPARRDFQLVPTGIPTSSRSRLARFSMKPTSLADRSSRRC